MLSPGATETAAIGGGNFRPFLPIGTVNFYECTLGKARTAFNGHVGIGKIHHRNLDFIRRSVKVLVNNARGVGHQQAEFFRRAGPQTEEQYVTLRYADNQVGGNVRKFSRRHDTRLPRVDVKRARASGFVLRQR